MKKEIIIRLLTLTIISILFISVLLTHVLAQDTAQTAAEATKGILTGIGSSISTILTPLFGEKEMLTRIFFAILLGMIIYSIVSIMFGGKKIVTWIITIAITSLALLALPANFLTAIRTTYGAMGAAILSVIPFAIILVFSVRVGSALVARLVWIFFCIYYFALYVYQIAIEKAGWWSAESIPYFFAIIAGLVIFLLIGPIRKAIFKGDLERIRESGAKVVERGKLLHRLQKEELKVYEDEAGNR